MLKLMQQLSIHLRWQLHLREMHEHSRQLQTCLQHERSRRSRVDVYQSTNWHSPRFQHNRLPCQLNFQLLWCPEQDTSHNLQLNQIPVHPSALHHIRRVRTHFYETSCDDWTKCLCREQLLSCIRFLLQSIVTAAAEILFNKNTMISAESVDSTLTSSKLCWAQMRTAWQTEFIVITSELIDQKLLV